VVRASPRLDRAVRAGYHCAGCGGLRTVRATEAASHNPEPSAMHTEQGPFSVEDARELYSIAHWSEG
jgi:hypothetical protein